MPSPDDYLAVVPESGLDLIFEEIVTSDVATIDTGTLATGYKSLRIEIGLRSDRADTIDTLGVYFNGDNTDANYNYYGARYSPSYSGASAQGTRVAIIGAGNNVAGYLSGTVLSILDHESTSFGKYWLAHNCNGDSSARKEATLHSGYWESDAPITSMSFFPQFGTDLTLGYVRVYGVR